MSCPQCQTKHEYNASCHDCGVRLILSAYPVAQLAKWQTEYIKTYFKADTDAIVQEAREKWKKLNEANISNR